MPEAEVEVDVEEEEDLKQEEFKEAQRRRGSLLIVCTISALLIPLPVTFYSRLHVFCST